MRPYRYIPSPPLVKIGLERSLTNVCSDAGRGGAGCTPGERVRRPRGGPRGVPGRDAPRRAARAHRSAREQHTAQGGGRAAAAGAAPPARNAAAGGALGAAADAERCPHWARRRAVPQRAPHRRTPPLGARAAWPGGARAARRAAAAGRGRA
eukprot:scaffold18923_cov36-Phaeocystis_antarctica.AAC.1